MADTEKKKYEVWSGRWDERLAKYAEFEAQSDEEALKKFEEYEKQESLKWDQLVLYPIQMVVKSVEERGPALKTIREPSDNNALDHVA